MERKKNSLRNCHETEEQEASDVKDEGNDGFVCQLDRVMGWPDLQPNLTLSLSLRVFLKERDI